MNIFFEIRSLLTRVERKEALVLIVLMLIGMFLETLGIGLIIPVITLMIQGDLISDNSVMASILKFLGNPSQAELIIIAMLALVGVYFVKNLFLAYLFWRQTSFSLNVQTGISQRLFVAYLRQSYTFHLQRNSAELVRNVTGEVGIFSNLLTSVILLTSEILVLIGISLLLLLVEPLGTLITAVVLGVTALGFYFMTRNRISRWGIERQHHDGLRLKHLLQGLASVKDVKLLGREDDFLAQYKFHNVKTFHAYKFYTILTNIPRLLFELLAVVGLATLVIIMVGQGRDIESIIPVLGLFAAAAFRLMPSVNRALSAVQTIGYSLPVINILSDELCNSFQESVSTSPNKDIFFNNELKLTDVAYSYPNTTVPALDSISISIRKGESIGIIGESGSGKSTLIDVIIGLFIPSTGVVELDGHETSLALRQWQDKIGYVPQSIYLTDDTLRHNIAFGLQDNLIDDIAIMEAVKSAQLEEFVDGLTEGIETIVGERGIRLSGGQRQRIGIARALYHNPSVLVLDEATSSLDSVTEVNVMQTVKELQGNKTIIIVAHRLSTVEQCDQLYKLDKGKVVASGSPKVILQQHEKLI